MKGKLEEMIISDELKAKSVSEVFSEVKYQQSFSGDKNIGELKHRRTLSLGVRFFTQYFCLRIAQIILLKISMSYSSSLLLVTCPSG